ncbi:MAG: hypothetical protein JRL30_09210 [Deltaproteobacteria bacterium]|nr:hypothetical protein [Deltaproteobacteria bacterium]
MNPSNNIFNTMTTQTFIIKSLLVQNSIMLVSLGAVVFFLVVALLKKRPRHLIAALVWVAIVLWFFNSAYFGFSTVSVSPQGICPNYGILSLRNNLLPVDSPWKIETTFSDIRKMKKVYFIKIGDHSSMRVKGSDGYALLEKIGEAIERNKGL